MALHSLYCAYVPLRNCSLTHLPQITRGLRRTGHRCTRRILPTPARSIFNFPSG